MKPAYELSIIMAVQFSEANVPAILSRLEPGDHPGVEFIFCGFLSHTETTVSLSRYDNVKLISANDTQNMPIPGLWREGILAAHADKVALSTAHCIPAANWVKRLVDTDLTACPGIGGCILNDEASNARSWAIYLMRYIAWSPPQEKKHVNAIAADNAVYRRKDIMHHSDLLDKGFWEPSFHQRFARAGMQLELDPELLVTHHNQYTSGQFFRQRRIHGRAFGTARADELGRAKRLLLILFSPILPFLFLLKIISATRKNGRYTAKLWLATPWLLWFLFAWGLGELQGYLSADWRSKSSIATEPGNDH